jgi:hypothetical protein
LTGNEDIEFETVRQAKELFNQCRILFNKLWAGKERFGDTANENQKLSSDKNLIKKQKSGSHEDGTGIKNLNNNI